MPAVFKRGFGDFVRQNPIAIDRDLVAERQVVACWVELLRIEGVNLDPAVFDGCADCAVGQDACMVHARALHHYHFMRIQ